jgi:methionyl-tRNA synthetase
MVEDLSSAEGCETCGSGNEPTGSIEVVCENCDKIVYKKEI